MNFAPPSVLFGESQLNARRKYHLKVEDDPAQQQQDNADDGNINNNDGTSINRGSSGSPSATNSSRPRKGSLADYFFGFLYEDECTAADNDDDDLLLYSSVVEPTTKIWNALNATLFAAQLLAAFADVVPVALVAHVGQDLLAGATADDDGGDNDNNNSASAFAARATVAAVLGTSVGKFVNGNVGDIFGARRTSALYSVLLALSLVVLACSAGAEMASRAFFLEEFFYSVQWPCSVVVLATHYRGNSSGGYEGGIYLTSLAGRLGSLIGFPVCSLLLRHVHWRGVALIGAWSALVSSSVTYLYLTDSPDKQNDPQNPIDESMLLKWFPDSVSRRKRLSLGGALRMTQFIVQENVLPSMKHILRSGTFWIVALAHTGASMVRTSERVVGTYLYETSNNTLSESRSAGLAVFLSVGTVAGLIIAGNMFAARHERERKWLISQLYILTLASCYILALFAIPSLRSALNSPELVTSFQVMAITAAGFGIAVQFYHIPSLVGATFGCDKGLFSSYSDGVAYGIASVVWRIVGKTVEHGNADGGGWAYGWAAVALLLIPTSLLMVEFFEHYFCRHRYGGSYETIIFA